jgi:hypothetical protein
MSTLTDDGVVVCSTEHPTQIMTAMLHAMALNGRTAINAFMSDSFVVYVIGVYS